VFALGRKTTSRKVGGLKRRGIGSGHRLYDRTIIKIWFTFTYCFYLSTNHLI
ncbi:unnamed protein product, partial [Musa textilis]